ncbi:MAG TPA: ABC transporter permease [Pyrinomonadaceae bacterium]|nr:ABC transporter permease [Pyrinomonadaceae bacterium]
MTLWHDIRYGCRMLWKNPGFTSVVVLTLALGIGANTAIFSVVDAVLLRPLPFPHPEQLVLVRDDLAGRQMENVGMSVPELKDFQQSADTFEEVAGVWPVDANLTGSDRPERIELLAVSPNYFSLLGASARLGRVFGPQDKAEGFAEGVVISDGLWRRMFGADTNVLGRRIYADTDAYTIIGVMPPGFRHPAQTLRNEVDMWANAGFTGTPFNNPPRGVRMLPGAIARVRAGVSVRQAQSQVDSLVVRLREQFPGDYTPEGGWSVRLLPVHENLVGSARTTLLVLLGAVGLVLLIGCVNIANLLLARSSARQREMAIRLALGASRRRVVMQLLTESLLLSLLGGAVALLAVVWILDVLVRFVPADIPRLQEVGFDGGVLAFVFGVSVLTGVLFGLVPALQASNPDLTVNLKEGGKGAGTGLAGQRFRGALVVTEIALSLVLMIAAGLLLRSFARLMEVDAGFDPHNVLMARIWLPVPNNPELDPYRPVEKRAAFVREVLRRASALPGVRQAAIGSGNAVPLLGPHQPGAFTIEEKADSDAERPSAQISSVTPEYFGALGTPLVHGRFFADSDSAESQRVALVDDAAARRFWPNEDPVGRRVKMGGRGSQAPWLTIVGVVGDIKSEGFDQPDQPHVYLSALQVPGYAMAVYLRADGDPSGLTQALRREVQAVDPNLPVFGERTMDDVVATSLAQRRFALQVVGGFGVLALLLAGVGVYGVVAYSVSQRTREIGIRLALGASNGAILRWVFRQGMKLTLFGMAAGLVGAFALTRLLRGLLFGVSASDPVTYAGLALLLAAVALLACYIPARRATKVDPMVALRHE